MIRVQHDANGITVWKYELLSNGDRNYTTFDGKTKTVKPGEPAPWWITLGNGDAHALADALTDFAAASMPEDYQYIKGQLEATKLHLADMRSLALLEPVRAKV